AGDHRRRRRDLALPGRGIPPDHHRHRPRRSGPGRGRGEPEGERRSDPGARGQPCRPRGVGRAVPRGGHGLLGGGGFTDGDRAAYLADHLGAERILLWGFDFERAAPTDPVTHELKLMKLTWASRVLGDLAREGRAPLLLWRPDGTTAPYPPGRYEESTT